MDSKDCAPAIVAEIKTQKRMIIRRGNLSERRPSGICRNIAPVKPAPTKTVAFPVDIPASIAKTIAMLDMAACTNEAKVVPTTAEGTNLYSSQKGIEEVVGTGGFAEAERVIGTIARESKTEENMNIVNPFASPKFARSCPPADPPTFINI